jgi:peptidyl-prolyl cis-trans isomerase C
VREELIRRELLVQEAKKMGLDKKPDVAAQADLARQAIFIRAFVQDYVKKHPISDEQAKAAYDRMKSQMGSTEYKVRHILVEKEDDAKTIIVNLKKGAKFDELAKQSKDPGSRRQGRRPRLEQHGELREALWRCRHGPRPRASTPKRRSRPISVIT